VSAPLTVADVLERAADLIEPEGAWTQGAYARSVYNRPIGNISRATCFCALGAMNVAAGASAVNQDQPEPHIAFANAVGIKDYLIATWNDAPERTQAEVVAKLREAAALVRAEGK
jgi:hypothetical protein